MTKQLGPTFGSETVASGLGGLPFTWGTTDDSIAGRENLTPEQNAMLDEVIAAHDPSKTAVPPTISNRQFYQALATPPPALRAPPGGGGAPPTAITQTEALSAMKTGELPPQLISAIKSLPQDQQFSAEAMLSGATLFERKHSMADTVMAALGYTPEQADDLWRLAATL
jgi:hypothetical protein